MKYSIIVPVYNAETTIAKCVESVLEQTEKDFELILVNDGSKDESGNICDEYARKDKRVCVIHKENGGVSTARNSGLKAAAGEYIVFIDSDDYVDTDYLESFNEASADLMIGGYQTEGFGLEHPVPHGYKQELFSTITSPLICDLLEQGRLNYVCTKCFLHRIIGENHILFDETLSLAEDTLFVLQYLQYCNTIFQVGGCKYHYVYYERETLSTINYLTSAGIAKMEMANELIYRQLCTLVDETGAMNVMICRMGRSYKPHIMQLLSGHRSSYRFVRMLFKQKWFRLTLQNAEQAYPDEGKKFWILLKCRSPLLFWLYSKVK